MIDPRHVEAGISVYCGDCREVMPHLLDCSVDSVVTDPPYHLTTGKKGGTGAASLNENSPAGRSRVTTGFMGKVWDGGDVAHDPAVWRECLRLLKPGGHLLAFGGTRTYHRLACAIEDAGFEIRDQIQWIYGSGFPKSLNLDNGIGTGLKPAHEPIVLARKPLIGTVKANVAEWGTGGLRIEDCRVEGVAGNGHWSGDDGSDATSKPGYDGGFTKGGRARPLRISHGQDSPGKNTYGSNGPGGGSHAAGETTLGRWPANVIHDGSDEVLAQFPDSAGQQGDVRGTEPSRTGVNVYGEYGRIATEKRGDFGSAARFFYCAKASKEDREEGLESFALLDTTETVNRRPDSAGVQSARAGAGRGAGAPIYTCKVCGLNLNGGRIASICPVNGQHVRGLTGYGERSRNHHPTVKPTELMRYLVRLITPPGGTVLDPFCGSGSTGKACALEQMNAILIDSEAEYCDLAAARSRLAQGLLTFA